MSIGGISSSNLSLMQQQIQSFRSGKTNIQKEDLEKLQSQTGGVQNSGTDPFSALLENFDQIDTNGDGISFEELTGHRPPPDGPGKEIFEKMKSGQGVSREELEAALSDMKSGGKKVSGKFSEMLSSFDSLDTNKDGQVTKEEMMAKMQGERAAFSMQMPTSETDIIEIFENYLNNKDKDESSNNLFKSQIQQYSNFSQSVEADRFSGIDLIQS
jgi:Ca2+-binding EF-hand superfamily protein